MSLTIRVLGLAALVALASAAAANAQEHDAEAIVERVRAALADLETLECSFEQLYFRAADSHTMIQQGTLALAQPSRFRVEDANKTVVTDGATVWMYMPGSNQVQLSAFSGAGENFPSPMNIFERYSQGRTPEWAGEDAFDGRTFDIVLLPAPGPDQNEVRVWIDREDSFPMMTFESFPTGDTLEYIIRDLRVNTALDDGLFTFNPPPDATVIDLRED